MDTLLIYYKPAAADHATWSTVNPNGELTSMLSHGSLKDAASLAEKHKTIVILDSNEIHINQVKLPVKNRQKLLQAIPYALEEQLADDVDELHFVAGKSSTDEITPVAAIRHTRIQSILEQLKLAGIYPDAIIPDVLCLAASSTQWCVLFIDNQLKVQFDTLSGGEFDPEVLPALLKSGLAKTDADSVSKVIYFTPNENEENSGQVENISNIISTCLDDKKELVRVGYNNHPLVIYCGNYQNAMPLNLLQETYKPKRKQNKSWHRWKVAASLAVTLLCLHIGTAAVQYFDFSNKNNQLQQQIEDIYRRTFPESKRIVNARVQMEEKLNELKGTAKNTSDVDILTLLANSASALASEKNVVLQTIQFRNNSIEIDLTSTNLQAVESINRKLNEQSAIKSEIIASSSEKKQVKGSIRIQKNKS